MHPELQALAECLVKLLVVILLLCDLCEHLQALLHQILLDHPQDLVLLQGLTGDVKRQILGIHHALHEVQPFRHQLLAVVHDEHATNIKFDVVAFLLSLEEVERRPARHKEQGPELQLPFHAEMLHSKVVLPIVGQGLVEASILFIRHVLRLAHPERFVLVKLFPFVGHLFDFLCFFLLLFLLFLLVDLLNLGFITFFLFLFGLTLIFTVRDFLLLALLHVELDGEADEL
mmetsp:Transcript_67568/g.106348  ORF Transcript_67568/g.106348 Transcript_67568/m.106348 type:complete len:230 (-) Transcript_67568:654-1343(-)